MDKEKIINQLQQKIDKKYLNTKIEDCYNMLALGMVRRAWKASEER